MDQFQKEDAGFFYKKTVIWVSFLGNVILMCCCLYIVINRYVTDSIAALFSLSNLLLFVGIMAALYGSAVFYFKLIRSAPAIILEDKTIYFHSGASMKAIKFSEIESVDSSEEFSGNELAFLRPHLVIKTRATSTSADIKLYPSEYLNGEQLHEALRVNLADA